MKGTHRPINFKMAPKMPRLLHGNLLVVFLLAPPLLLLLQQPVLVVLNKLVKTFEKKSNPNSASVPSFKAFCKNVQLKVWITRQLYQGLRHFAKCQTFCKRLDAFSTKS